MRLLFLLALVPALAWGAPGWAVTRSYSADRMMVIEVEADRPHEARQIADAIMESVQSLYEEVLIYVRGRDGSADASVRRVQWTRRGYVETIIPPGEKTPGARGRLLTSAAPARVTARAQAPRKTVWDGVYTEAQAARGERTYNRACAYCHGGDLGGTDDPGGPPLKGLHFSFRWQDVTVAEMFATIGETMPKNAPASLSPAVLIDVVGFLFQANRMPAGKTDLPPDPEVLEKIRITDRKP